MTNIKEIAAARASARLQRSFLYQLGLIIYRVYTASYSIFTNAGGAKIGIYSR